MIKWSAKTKEIGQNWVIKANNSFTTGPDFAFFCPESAFLTAS